MIMAMPMFLTSCGGDSWNDDYRWSNDGDDSRVEFCIAMAQTLAGQWRGDLAAYGMDANNRVVDSLIYETDIQFNLPNSNQVNGTGTQYDYEIIYDAQGNKITAATPVIRTFSWYINTSDGSIHIVYQGSNGTFEMVIAYDDLNLDERRFTGYMVSTNGSEVDDFFFYRYTRASTGQQVKKIMFMMK